MGGGRHPPAHCPPAGSRTKPELVRVPMQISRACVNVGAALRACPPLVGLEKANLHPNLRD